MHRIFGRFFTAGILLLSLVLNVFGQQDEKAQTSDSRRKYIFFLHNKFLEEHGPDENHPEYGKAEYDEILTMFRKGDFIVKSEKRPANTDVRAYARKVVGQINDLISSGVKPGRITVIGTSKGGYIAQYVSTYLGNPKVNFVFVGSYQEADLENFKDINFCGNILTIYDISDVFGVSAKNRRLSSNLEVTRFKEIELNTGLKHGYLFKPSPEWIQPSILWARQEYDAVNGNSDKLPAISLKVSTLYDDARKRSVPIAIYTKDHDRTGRKQPLLIFSHGYGLNKGGSYLAYSYLTEYLAAKGYFVVSIQHELPGDDLIPNEGIPQVVRRPFWVRGADSIRFVIDELRKSNQQLDLDNISLIGHSNGADTTALFPQKYANLISKIITLDNRRMALPRTTSPKVYSLRSSDQPADEGVLPTEDEQKKFGITIVNLPNTIHDNMDDSANERQRQEIRNYVMSFLRDDR